MAQGYWKNKMNIPCVFDMFFRKNPFNGGFAVCAGTETFIDALLNFRFSDEDIEYLNSLGCFEEDFLTYLKEFKFTGDVYAIDEGSLVFPNEPLVRIHANLIEAQIIEDLVLNHINFQTLIATKACRVYLASKCAPIMEFGLRRAQGSDGALTASRACYIGMASSSSNVMAAKEFGIPCSGTMAHSWVMSFPSELEAFEAYAKIYPDKAIFLIDTYDTLNSGIENAIKVGSKLVEKGYNFGVRLDSGDIEYLANECRKRLDKAGFPQAKITVSNELTEEIIEQLVADKTPVDSWGVGSHMVTGGNEASLTGVYKLAAKSCGENLPMEATMKLSDNPEKTTNPGIKNVWRLYDENGMMKADILALEEEVFEPGKEYRFFHPSMDFRQFVFTASKVEKLLKKRIDGGRRIGMRQSNNRQLIDARDKLQSQLRNFDATYLRIINPHIYKVSITEKLKNLKLKFIEENLK
ncbi:MAG: nicotinate phosphoribosyltransferase [Treponemataceae bacterium]|nr:nicotinate phosphoribosyltransferase [Treponemataceae bacterium]